jgi:hypothetical protein
MRLLDSSAGEGSGPEHDREEHEPEPERRDRCHEVLFCDRCISGLIVMLTPAGTELGSEQPHRS